MFFSSDSRTCLAALVAPSAVRLAPQRLAVFQCKYVHVHRLHRALVPPFVYLAVRSHVYWLLVLRLVVLRPAYRAVPLAVIAVANGTK